MQAHFCRINNSAYMYCKMKIDISLEGNCLIEFYTKKNTICCC